MLYYSLRQCVLRARLWRARRVTDANRLIVECNDLPEISATVVVASVVN